MSCLIYSSNEFLPIFFERRIKLNGMLPENKQLKIFKNHLKFMNKIIIYQRIKLVYSILKLFN